jgi:hypothetical protein
MKERTGLIQTGLGVRFVVRSRAGLYTRSITLTRVCVSGFPQTLHVGNIKVGYNR